MEVRKINQADDGNDGTIVGLFERKRWLVFPNPTLPVCLILHTSIFGVEGGR